MCPFNVSVHILVPVLIAKTLFARVNYARFINTEGPSLSVREIPTNIKKYNGRENTF